MRKTKIYRKDKLKYASKYQTDACLHHFCRKILFHRNTIGDGEGLHRNTNSTKGQDTGCNQEAQPIAFNFGQMDAAVCKFYHCREDDLTGKRKHM